VVLSEDRLPDGTWIDLVEFLRTQDNPPPVVVMSGNADDRLWGEVLNLGGFDVLTKPLVRSETLQVLALALHYGRSVIQRWGQATRAGG
jgi:FixJ family two-component response regulator